MKYILSLVILLTLAGCSTTFPDKDERLKPVGHVNEPFPQMIDKTIPPVVDSAPIVSPPKPTKKLQTFTVVATDLPARDLLFALARDARLNLDIDPAIEGKVSINAIDQTLPQILKRIARQVKLRYTLDGPNLIVERDRPYTRVYRIDYLNMARKTTSDVSVNTQIASPGSGEGGGGGSNSSTSVSNKADNEFWKTLESNLGALAEGGSVVSHRETGTILVTATQSAHRAIQGFLDQVLANARKQVLIEATVVEVTLNDEFQAGVDWARLAQGDGWSFQQSMLAGNLGSAPFVAATYANSNSDRAISASIRALHQFGDVSVMSSPKIMALNNQTSVLKVVDNRVYFTTEIEEKEATNNSPAKTTYTTTIHTVPVGFVMNVTPYITETDEVILNIRPTLSRILQFIDTPNPALAAAGVSNKVPEIQVREMESVLRVANGNTAVIGGLMQDTADEGRRGIPGLHDVDGFGYLFGTKSRKYRKTELVIFLRPRVVRNASVNTDLRDFKRFLTPERKSE